MASRLNPYVMFDGTARAAMQFYEGVFGGTLTMHTFAESGAPEVVDPEGVMHALLETPDGFTLMASDLPPGMPQQAGSSISVSLSGDDTDALRGWWQQLSDGGNVNVPLEKQVWGDEFGACTDRFGLDWMVNITGA